MIRFILAFFDYWKIPKAAVKLAYWIKMEAREENPDMKRIEESAGSLEKLFRIREKT